MCASTLVYFLGQTFYMTLSINKDILDKLRPMYSWSMVVFHLKFSLIVPARPHFPMILRSFHLNADPEPLSKGYPKNVFQLHIVVTVYVKQLVRTVIKGNKVHILSPFRHATKIYFTLIFHITLLGAKEFI